MYVPSSFAETDINVLHHFIEQNSFATLVTHRDDEPFASHIPVLLDRNQGEYGQLIGHFAKANPQSKTETLQNVLTIFHGPHAYISPTWYEAPDLVPTWNYQAVHVYGRYSVIDDSDQLIEILKQYVSFYEADQPTPWTMENVDPAFVDQLLQSIVGFTIKIERIEGKFKLNQNHPVERREKVIHVLQQQESENSQAIAAQMQAHLRD
ncbi:MAG: FMN-binding negative transcriptional regulator [Planctomycetes bacterium]|nr:FMN-binding negative transcriptional regulator [Planctomycetota bacterium]MCH9723469.1 FMN-binding negative transcriptional regulator [Planctomycetota bacterium]MCH9775262.1 FMN-binding negative transcriptional regulator [Planctomycetota bacterium]MCH9789729.1 FMN-binding negative transcriptional regulator [Planctomycetota bacterium]